MPRLPGPSYLKGESGWEISGIAGGRVGTGVCVGVHLEQLFYNSSDRPAVSPPLSAEQDKPLL